MVNNLVVFPPGKATGTCFAQSMQKIRGQATEKLVFELTWGRTLQGRLLAKQRDEVRARRDKALLDIKERMLAQQLVQQGALKSLLNHLFGDAPDKIRSRLKDRDAPVRWLAAQAVGIRRLPLEAELIDLLSDRQAEVREAAHQSLVRLGRGTDFGPTRGATKKQHAAAIAHWRDWLALQQEAAVELARKPDLPHPDNRVRFDPNLGSKATAPSATLRTEAPLAQRLADDLVAAQGPAQQTLLEQLRDRKGAVHSDALSLAIPRLKGTQQTEARTALAQRFQRMTVKTLRAKLAEDDAEVRRAAATACAQKEARELLPELAVLLEDADGAVVQAARAALKQLTSQDFGPELGADAEQRRAARQRWQKWREREKTAPTHK